MPITSTLKNILFALTLSIPGLSHAGFWDSLSGIFTQPSAGEQQRQEALPTTPENSKSWVSNSTQQSSLEIVSNKLNISSQEATAGLGAILNQAKHNLSTRQFSEITNYIPNINQLLAATPHIKTENFSGLTSLLGKTSQTSNLLQSTETLVKQFKAAGLSTNMITQISMLLVDFLSSHGVDGTTELLKLGLM